MFAKRSNLSQRTFLQGLAIAACYHGCIAAALEIIAVLPRNLKAMTYGRGSVVLDGFLDGFLAGLKGLGRF